MDKLVLLLPMLLGGVPFVFFRGVAPATLCMVCKLFNKGKCLESPGNCTVEEAPGCRTRDFFYINERDGLSHEHTELDCSDHCSPSNFHHGALKISTFCCKGQDFCNRYQGNEREYKF